MGKQEKVLEKTPKESRHFLQHFSFAENQPGSLLHDFEQMLQFIQKEPIPVSKKGYLLPQKVLAPINSMFSSPIEINMERPALKSYPPLQGLYLLLRAANFTIISPGEKPLLTLNPDILSSWQKLNLTEKYFALLETFIFFAEPEIISERGHFDHSLQRWKRIWDQLSKKEYKKHFEEKNLKYLGPYHLALFELFGFVQITYDISKKTGRGIVKTIKKTDFGKVFNSLLFHPKIISFIMNNLIDEPLSLTFGMLQPFFKPLFPQWKNNLAHPSSQFQNGNYIFKVSLKKNIWRQISIPATHNFHDLSNMILDAFDFDYDHLYIFTFKNSAGLKVEIFHPAAEEPLFADEVSIGQFSFQKGTTLNYLYDFGDCWKFKLTLEDIDANSKAKTAKILESKGKNPEQYPDY